MIILLVFTAFVLVPTLCMALRISEGPSLILPKTQQPIPMLKLRSKKNSSSVLSEIRDR